MILVMKPQVSEDSLNSLVGEIEKAGLNTHISKGEEVTIVGLVGDKTKIDLTAIEAHPAVDKVILSLRVINLQTKNFIRSHPDLP